MKLTAGDYLGGWLTHLYGGALPPRLLPKETRRTRTAPSTGGATRSQADSRARKEPSVRLAGEGRRDPRPQARRSRPTRPVPSKLAYFRPLRPGETLRYEFFYEPGKTHVHPSLGRLAFLLEPDGVKLHWLTDTAADDWTGLTADNVDRRPGRPPRRQAAAQGRRLERGRR